MKGVQEIPWKALSKEPKNQLEDSSNGVGKLTRMHYVHVLNCHRTQFIGKINK